MGQALPFIGMGMTAGANVLNGIQQQQYTEAVQKANDEAMQASHKARMDEVARQAAFTAQAMGGLTNTQAAVGPAQNAVNRGNYVTDFMKTFDAQGSTIPDALAGQENTTSLVRDAIAKRAATAAQDARTRVGTLAKLGSFDNAMSDSGLALQSNSDYLQQLGGMRRGSLAVAQQQASVPPSAVYGGNNLISPLLGAAGQFIQGNSGQAGGFGGYTVDGSGNYTPNYGIFNGLFY